MYRCVGDSALLAGSYQTIGGVYVDTLQSVSGCDSNCTLIDTVVYSATDLELCYGDSALFGGVCMIKWSVCRYVTISIWL